MKRFSLNKKRVSKVLALTLMAAMVVPGVPAQKLVAADDGSGSVDLPDPIATVNFANASSYSLSDSVTGKQLKFTTATEEAIWNIVTADGVKTDVTYSSIDKVPEMVDGATDKYDPDSYVWESIDVAPTVVESENTEITTGNVVLNAVSLKDSVDVADVYPAQASNDYSKIQRQKRYSSGVEIANPFAGSTTLYDASRYTMDNIVDTATEVDRGTVAETPWKTPWGDIATKLTAPEAKTGVTISFWAQAPVGESALEDTNFFEFYNTDSLIYSPDDLGKAWLAYQIDNTTDWGTDDPDSLYYKGEIVTGTIWLIGNNGDARSAFNTMTGKDAGEYNVTDRWDLARNYSADVSDCGFEVTYIKNAGPLALYNPEAREAYAEAEAFYNTTATNGVETGTLFEVEAISPIDAWGTMGGHYARLVYVLGEDEEGNLYHYGLGKSADMPTSGVKSQVEASSWGQANYVPYKVDDTSESGYGSSVRYKKDGVGNLFMNQKQTYYMREATTYDANNQYEGSYIEKGEKKTGQLQAQNNAYIGYENEVTDTEWHYYTVTLTDEWMQVYIDGVACDVAAIENNPYCGDKFNMVSGLYDPASDTAYGTAYDNLRKLTGAQTGQRAMPFNQGSVYGYMFGDSIMKFITDPNTKLYIGGKTRTTAAGTLVANVAFYDVKMTAEQAAAAYDAACEDAIPGFEVTDVPTPGPSGTLGDVNGDTVIDAKDALAILKYSLGLDPGDDFDVTVANVNGDTTEVSGETVACIDSKDALDILKYSLGLIDHFTGEE